MMGIRYFGSVKFVSDDGSVVVERADGIGRVFIREREADAAGSLVIGDVVEFSIMPGGIATGVLLDRRARRLAAAS